MQKSIKIPIKVLSMLSTIVLGGCALFVSHYDAGAYQNFTNLKAFHIKFVEDNEISDGRLFNESKTQETCDTGELRFREATEYAGGKHDITRLNAISYLHNVFVRNCKMALNSKTLFGAAYAEQQIDELKKNYDFAIEGEIVRVNEP